jgi:hypothetical protein
MRGFPIHPESQSTKKIQPTYSYMYEVIMTKINDEMMMKPMMKLL